jgi:hypothetical protein
MKNVKILVLALTSLIFGEYLQQGTHPECSYVIVTEDGWRVHKNNEGKVLSMKAPSTHNDKVGKYSFDEYGNLIEFYECISKEEIINKIDKDVASNTDSKVKLKIDFDSKKALGNFGKIFSDASFSINGGLVNTYKLSDLYPLGYYCGLDINFKKLSFSLLSFNISNEGPTEEMTAYDNDENQPNLTGNGFLINYNLNWKNFYVKPGLGIIMTKGETRYGGSADGTDQVLKTDIGIYVGKSKNISIYGSGMLSLTEIGEPGKALYFNMGIKYNF